MAFLTKEELALLWIWGKNCLTFMPFSGAQRGHCDTEMGANFCWKVALGCRNSCGLPLIVLQRGQANKRDEGPN
jgi:hypothetical protein